MRDRLNEAIQTIQDRRHKARRYGLVMAVLALLTLLCVSWRLHQVGISMTADDELYHCGYEAHEHTEECYTDTLVCGYEEGELENPVDPEPEAEPEPEEPMYEEHHHTDACYEEHEELICDQEEHVHEDYCYDAETGELLDNQEEHEHDDSCYETVRELVCGYEEGELIPVEENTAEPEEPVDPEPAEEPVYHHHTEACYEKELTCTIPEHEHTAACLADRDADVEDDSDWEQFVQPETSSWNEALIQVAKDQLGYTESLHNFELAADGETERHYTRYGTWYGNPYGAWDVMFAAFCQHYAGIPDAVIPQRAGLYALRTDLAKVNPDCLLDGGAKAAPGDLVTYYNSEGEETIGIVTEADETALTVISGAVDGAVAEVQITRADVTNTISVTMAYRRYTGASDADEDADAESPWRTLESDEQSAFEVKAAVGVDTTIDKKQAYDLSGITNDHGALAVKIKVRDGDDQPWRDRKDGEKLTDGQTIRFDLDFTAPGGTLKDQNGKLTRILYYQLPEGLASKPDTGTVYNTVTKEPIGTLDVDANGFMVLRLNDDVNLDADFEANLYVQAEIKMKGGVHEEEIKFPGTGTTVTVYSKRDLTVTKEGSEKIKYDEKGPYLEFTVTASSVNGTADKTIDISDAITATGSNGSMLGSYDDFKLVGPDGNEINPGTKLTKSDDGKSFSIKGLPALPKDSAYTLTYKYRLDGTKHPNGKFGNTAQAQYDGQKEPSEDVWTKDYSAIVTKTSGFGIEDLKFRRVYWEITVENPDGKDLGKLGYVLTDTVRTSGATIKGNVTIDPQTNTDTIVANGQAGFTYEFPEGSTKKKYTFTYYTNIVTGSDPTKLNIQNDVDLKKGDTVIDKTTGSATQGGAVAGTLKRKAWDNIQEQTDGSGMMSWNITVKTSPTSDAARFTATDTFQLPTADKYTTTADHYALKGELETQLKAGMVVFTPDGPKYGDSYGNIFNADGIVKNDAYAGLKVEFHFYSSADASNATEVTDDNGKVRRFTITLDWSDAKNQKNAGLYITQINVNDYRSYVDDLSKLTQDVKWTIPNLLTCDTGVNSGDQYEYKKETPTEKQMELQKLVTAEEDATDFKEKLSSSIEYKEDGTTFWYELWIKNPSKSFSIEDTLPSGLEYTGTYYVGVNSGKGNGRKKLAAFAENDFTGAGYLTIQKEMVGERQRLTFTLNNLDTVTVKDGSGIAVLFQVKVNDSDYWNDITNEQSKTYSNTATGSWDQKNTDTVDATVERKNFYMDKVGEPDKDDKTRVNYTVTINTGGRNLLNKTGLLTVKDSFTVPKDVTAAVDPDSIKLVANGVDVTDTDLKTLLVPREGTVDSSGKTTYTIQASVPDGQEYQLAYTYVITADDSMSDMKLTLVNSVELAGHVAKTDNMDFKLPSSGGTGTSESDFDILKLLKVEQNRENKVLKDAKFTLSKYENGTWTSVNENVETGADGTFVFATKEKGGYQQVVNYNTLYKLVETEAPSGYEKTDKAYYFILMPINETDTAAAYRAATGGIGLVGDMTQDEKDSIFYGQHGPTKTLQVDNAAQKLWVTKAWVDEKGFTIRGSNLPEVTVQLYRYPADGTPAQKEKVGEPVTLSDTKGWTHEFTGLETGYCYFVEELNVPKGYTVTYSKQEGLVSGDRVTITNHKKATELRVEKLWQDENGADLEGTDLASLQAVVKLYSYKPGEQKPQTPAGSPVETATLNAKNGWVYTFKGLDPDKLYYVVEEPVSGFEVTYQNNEGVLPGETITLTNTRKASAGYELPSTGGTGTKRNTAGGFLLMGAALVCGVIFRRRRERRGG